MQKLFYFLLVFVALGCSSDDSTDVTLTDPSYFEIKINGETYNSPDIEIISNENCGYLFASVKNNHLADTHFRMNFELTTEGYLKKVALFEYSNENTEFRTVDFKPAETFQISNFDYNTVEQTVYFEFEGYLYEDGSPENTKFVEGKFSYHNTDSFECGTFIKKVTANAAIPLNFTNWSIISHSEGLDYSFYSENGYILKVTLPHDVQTIQSGSYTFDSSSTPRISLHKYTGPLRASLSQLHYSEWLTYNCEGTITITGHEQAPYPHITGSFSFTTQATEEEQPLQIQGSFEI